MRIMSLIDDVCDNKNLKSEHGLSLYFEDNGKKYLVDTGQSGKFIINAKRLGIDITDIDAVFISHNHYDHTDGLKEFFKVNDKAKVYMKSDAKYDYYAKPFVKVSMKFGIYRNNANRFLLIDEAYQIGRISLLSDTVADASFFCQDTRLLMKKGTKFYPDDFSHELFIAIKDKDKVHVISSCSHRGIVNILKSAKKRFGLEIGTVYAGLHMSANGGKKMNCSAAYFEKVCRELDIVGFEKLYTCHCTGLFAFEKLQKRLGEKVLYAKTGDEVIL